MIHLPLLLARSVRERTWTIFCIAHDSTKVSNRACRCKGSDGPSALASVPPWIHPREDDTAFLPLLERVHSCVSFLPPRMKRESFSRDARSFSILLSFSSDGWDAGIPLGVSMVLFRVVVMDPFVDVDPGDERRNDNGTEGMVDETEGPIDPVKA